ncbi:restriction endonuclease subunit S [Erythrobacter mangrovi]|uniref:Restriction endonuclease subunit S n=1 Tax=Erythrobacter mangrovi TaxID=2739433 RepID=A0A7D3XIY2_9SPHN|nr:restriction endonuclease subunit S [Erythrobacter mangrovi]QKG72278.1 restriction endonuclease subunit S [Erythrobacter mangrovi]
MAEPDAMMRGTLGDFFSISREKGSEGLPTLSVTMHDGLVRRDSIDRKTESELEDGEHLRVRPGDIAYNMMRMWQGASGLATEDGIVSPAYVVVRPKKMIDPLFASYWFKSERMIYLFWAYSYGLTNDRLRLYAKDFTQIPVEVPPITKQRRIAEMLADFERAIEATDAMILAKQQRKRNLTFQILGALGPDVPFAALKTVTSINASSLSEATDPNFEFEYFPIATDLNDELDAAGWMTFGESPSRARRLAKPGDAIYSTVRPLLRRCFRAPDNPKAVYSTGYAVLGGGEKLNPRFLYHLLTSPDFERQINARLTGSNYPAISAGDLGEVSVPLPPISQQNETAELLDAFDREIDLLAERATLLREQRRGLMQKILSFDHKHQSAVMEVALI